MPRMDRHPTGHPHRPSARPARWSRRTGGCSELAPLRRELAGVASLFVRPSDPPSEGRDDRPRRCVLIVDDNDFGRETLGLILQADGYQVRQAGSSREALGCLDGAPAPGLILMDLDGGRDARCLLRRMRTEPALRNIPVIAVSAVEPGLAIPQGVVACFEKPIAVDALRAAVGHYCR